MTAADTLSKPHTIIYAERALWAWTAWICLFGIYQSWSGIPEIETMVTDQFQGAVTVDSHLLIETIIGFYVFVAALSAWVILKIGAGKSWARKSLMWGFAFEAVCAVMPPYHGISGYLTDIPDYGLQAYALYFLYTKPGSGWFGRTRQQA